MHSAKSRTLYLQRTLYRNPDQAARRQWWLRNGLGAFACGNIAGTLAHEHQALLADPRHSSLTLALASAALVTDAGCHPLFSAPGLENTSTPEHFSIESFRLDGRMPAWLVNVAGVRLEHRIWLEPTAHTTYLAYRQLLSPQYRESKSRIRIQCLINDRTASDPSLNNPVAAKVERQKRRFVIHSHHGTTLILQACGNPVAIHSVDRMPEPLPNNCHWWTAPIELELPAGEWIGIAASFDRPASPYLEEALRRFYTHEHYCLIQACLRVAHLADAAPWIDNLLLHVESLHSTISAAEKFEKNINPAPRARTINRPGGILPVLPGLTLATGRLGDARKILQACTAALMEPPAQGGEAAPKGNPSRNDTRNVPWLIEGWRAYFEQVRDTAMLKKHVPELDNIIDRQLQEIHGRGPFPWDLPPSGNTVDGQGMQTSAEEKLSPAAAIAEYMEIGALWYNALRILAVLCRHLGRDNSRYTHLANKVCTGLQRVVGDYRDGWFNANHAAPGRDAPLQLRQILAISLHFSPLDRKASMDVLNLSRRLLLPIYGLKREDSLRAVTGGYPLVAEVTAPDSEFPTRAWWLGQYALAEYRVHRNVAAARALLEPLKETLLEPIATSGGTASDPPHLDHLPDHGIAAVCALDAWWRLERTLHQTQRCRSGDKTANILEQAAPNLRILFAQQQRKS